MRLRTPLELKEEWIMALPSTGIHVRYSNARKPKLLSYAVHPERQLRGLTRDHGELKEELRERSGIARRY